MEPTQHATKRQETQDPHDTIPMHARLRLFGTDLALRIHFKSCPRHIHDIQVMTALQAVPRVEIPKNVLRKVHEASKDNADPWTSELAQMVLMMNDVTCRQDENFRRMTAHYIQQKDLADTAHEVYLKQKGLIREQDWLIWHLERDIAILMEQKAQLTSCGHILMEFCQALVSNAAIWSCHLHIYLCSNACKQRSSRTIAVRCYVACTTCDYSSVVMQPSQSDALVCLMCLVRDCIK